MARRRVRTKPKLEISGINKDYWKSETTRVRWAQTDPMFRELMTVLINERDNICNLVNRNNDTILGAHLCYEKVIDLFRDLTKGKEQMRVTEDPMTYSPDEDIPIGN